MPTARRKSCKRGNPRRKLTKRVIHGGGGGNKQRVEEPPRERMQFLDSRPETVKANKGKSIFGGLRNWLSSKLTKQNSQEQPGPFGTNAMPVTKTNPLGNVGTRGSMEISNNQLKIIRSGFAPKSKEDYGYLNEQSIMDMTFRERALVGKKLNSNMPGPGERIQSGQRRGNTSTPGELPIKKPPTLEERQREEEIQTEIQAVRAAQEAGAGYMLRAAAGHANQMKKAARAEAAKRRAAAAIPSVSLQPTAVTSQSVEPPKVGLRRMGAFTGGKYSASAARAGMYLPPPTVASEA